MSFATCGSIPELNARGRARSRSRRLEPNAIRRPESGFV